MKKTFLLALCALSSAWLPGRAAESKIDYSHIEIYVAPFYNSEGPSVAVGRYSSGLAAVREKEFLATISRMKKNWDQLTFAELNVAAIRLYDLGYRQDSIYWFYTGQVRGRQFAALVDEEQMGGPGSAGFELFHVTEAFHELAGPYITGYAFGDPDGLVRILERVQKEARKVPDLAAVYPGVAFKPRSEWETENAPVAEGIGALIAVVKEQKAEIKRQRVERGVEQQFGALSSKPLPSL